MCFLERFSHSYFSSSTAGIGATIWRELKGSHKSRTAKIAANCGRWKPQIVKTHLYAAFVKNVGKIVCKTFIYLYVCMQDVHNYTHKSMYTWVVIADANWCSGSYCPRTESGATSGLLQKFPSTRKCEECIDSSAPLSLRVLGCKITLSALSRVENMLSQGFSIESTSHMSPTSEVRARDLETKH